MPRKESIMALIKCPECYKEILSEAKTYPNCGIEIKNQFSVKNKWFEKKISDSVVNSFCTG